MTVLQIIKGLAGEEDINFGDSDTTFARQTRTGGTTNIHYIDDKSIPANTLGGVINDHLHGQNTDTGTDSTSFIINSGGNMVTLNASGLGADRAFTFPDTVTTQKLVGATDLASVTGAATNGAKTIGVYDSGGYLTSTNVEDALAELAVSIAAIPLYTGFKRGFNLSFVSTSVINISIGTWDHFGTTHQIVYTTTSLNYNPVLSSDGINYIYLDDSAIAAAGTNLINATMITNSTTAPTWSNTRCGWYNGLDRCIGAILISSGAVTEFRIFSNDYYVYKAANVLYTSANSPTTATSLDLSGYIPAFSTRCRIAVQHATDGDQVSFLPATGWAAKCQITIADTGEYHDGDLCLDTDQTVLWLTDTDSQTIIALHGYYMGDL